MINEVRAKVKSGESRNAGLRRKLSIAWQLGNGSDKYFKAVQKHDDQKIAPGGDVIRKMLPDGPVLILMDELMNYISRGRKLGMRDELFNFMQNLCEEARARDNVVVCASIPASELEMNPDDMRDHESLKKLLDRLGRAIMMAAETESAEIIRRRLFEWGGSPEDGRKAALEYADWAIDHATELSGVDASNARDLFLAAYPFHLSLAKTPSVSVPAFFGFGLEHWYEGDLLELIRWTRVWANPSVGCARACIPRRICQPTRV